MSDQNAIRIIVDTNLWISFCIGTKLTALINAIIQKKVILCFSEELYNEIFSVLERPKIQAIIKKDRVKELFTVLEHRVDIINSESSHDDCRDPKDNFLLDLAVDAKAQYLITGDLDLLVLNPFKGIRILKAHEFEEIINKHL